MGIQVKLEVYLGSFSVGFNDFGFQDDAAAGFFVASGAAFNSPNAEGGNGKRENAQKEQVKRFYSSDTTVTLMPQSTNPEHKPQLYDVSKTSIRILGKVVNCAPGCCAYRGSFSVGINDFGFQDDAAAGFFVARKVEFLI